MKLLFKKFVKWKETQKSMYKGFRMVDSDFCLLWQISGTFKEKYIQNNNVQSSWENENLSLKTHFTIFKTISTCKYTTWKFFWFLVWSFLFFMLKLSTLIGRRRSAQTAPSIRINLNWPTLLEQSFIFPQKAAT